MDRPVLHVLDHALPEATGYAVRSHNLLRYLRESGVPVVGVVSSRANGAAAEDVIDGVPYVRLPLRLPDSRQTAISLARRIASLARWLQREIRRRGIGLVHAHTPAMNGIAALWAARRTGVPVVYETRSLWEDAAVARGVITEESLRYRGTRGMETWLLRRVDAVASISRALIDEITDRGVSADRIFHAPNAIDTSRFSPAPADAELMAQHRLTGAMVIGYIGYFFAYEGVDDLVRAFAQARSKLPRAKLLLVGDGEEEEALRTLVRQLEIESDVVFVGSVPHASVQRYYSLCDIVAYPRRANRCTELVTPLKPLEAMAMAKPTILSDVGGMRELNAGENGLIAAASNPGVLAQTLVALGNDAARRTRLGNAARLFVTEHHAWPRVVAAYRDVYRRLLAPNEVSTGAAERTVA